MTERCVNLTQAEAKAWAAGAKVLIRPAKMVVSIERGQQGSKAYFDPAAPKWQPGDVLIGREAWHTDMLPISDAIARHEDVMSGGGSWPVIFYRADPANDDSGCIWRSPATMPKALARHRRRVVSVRVCRAAEITPAEAEASGMISTVSAPPSMWVDAFLGATGTHPEAWVSVTITEAA